MYIILKQCSNTEHISASDIELLILSGMIQAIVYTNKTQFYLFKHKNALHSINILPETVFSTLGLLHLTSTYTNLVCI
jgi:hypothetical protein